MDINTDENKVEELLTRGVAEVIDKEDLRKRLLIGDTLRIKLGIDPTSEHLHLGRSIPLLKLRDFQDLGHKVILIIGDFTGVVGDTSDKESERPMLSEEEIQQNLTTYADQAGKILDMKKVELHRNSEWLGTLTYNEIAYHANEFSINQFISRDIIKRRLDDGKRVSLREVLYPLMQGYDSVAIESDVEIGGTDQRFNLLAGRDLQKMYHLEPQNIVMGEMIEGVDGQKMSSSAGNTIKFLDTPADMYGKIMSVDDGLIVKYFTLLTRVSTQEIKEIEQQITKGTNPKEIKHRLAHTIVTMYHNTASADTAEKKWKEMFQEKKIPDDIPQIPSISGEILVDTIVRSGCASSKNEARRLIDEGAVSNRTDGGDVVIKEYTTVIPKDSVIQVGKRRFFKTQ